MSAMVNLEIPWINIMSKMDLVTSNPDDETGSARNGPRKRKNLARCDEGRPSTYTLNEVNPGTAGFLILILYSSQVNLDVKATS